MPMMTRIFVLLAVMMAFAPAAFAEMAAGGIQATLDKVSTEDTKRADVKNTRLLEAKVRELERQIAALQRMPGRQAEVAQLQAVADALKEMIARVDDGESITDYRVNTDVATLETTVSVEFTDKDGKTSRMKVRIPSAYDSASEQAETAASQPDPLTQALQQMAAQPPMAGQANPLAGIQPAVNGLVNNQGSYPFMPMSPQVLSAANSVMQCKPDGSQVASNGTAVYDISGQKLYMPDGSVLEAHSGTGSMMDNPQFVNVRMQGSTPPGTYNLTMREGLFHNYEALRMNPTGNTQMFGRDGILMHPPLNRNGGSSGCTVSPQYSAILAAFKAGQLKQVVVVDSLGATQNCAPPTYNTSTPGAPVAPSAPTGL